MKSLLAFLILLPALGQQPAAEQAKPEEKKAEAAAPEETKKDEGKKEEEAKAESPVPSAEQWFSGSLDFGYRWLTDLQGNNGVFRSVVNLGEGPRLTGLDITLQDPKKRLFDRIDVRGNSWGGDPYNTAHVDARKRGVYDFRFDYRNIAYFNYLPSYANPFLGQGVLATQRGFDTWRRMSSFQLDLMPGRRVTPYFAYERNSGRGRFLTDFVAEGNEYAVPSTMSETTDNVRGGVRVEFNRFHATFEQGATMYRDDQSATASLRNDGNRSTELLGQTLALTSLTQQYGVDVDSKYSKVLLTASPTAWINLYGQFLYSQPETTVKYSDAASGNLVLLSSLLFYSGQQDVATGLAKMPRTSGNFGFEMRPHRRVRVIESFMTDRMHNAGFGLLTETLLLSANNSRVLPAVGVDDRLVLNYNQQQLDVLFDVTSRITLRGGHRYVWGDATTRAGQLSAIGNLESGELKRQVGLAGVTARPLQKLFLSADYEGASSDSSYFRTSLYDYQKAKLRARYQLFGNLSLQAQFSFLSNENPSPGVRYDFFSRDTTLSAQWTPAGGKRVSVSADYSRSTLRSDINYLVPQQLSDFERSFYRDNAHTATSLVDLALPGSGAFKPRLSLGGSLFVSSGSRPTRYYQPMAKLSLPIEKHVYWNTEWRWFGFSEPFYAYEGFRAHAFMTGLRLVK
jgi:hypothetical protein